MTSFLALRASVCAYLLCLIPSVCYIGRQFDPPLTRSDLLLAPFPQAEGRQFVNDSPSSREWFVTVLSQEHGASARFTYFSSVDETKAGLTGVVVPASAVLEEYWVVHPWVLAVVPGQLCAGARPAHSGSPRVKLGRNIVPTSSRVSRCGQRFGLGLGKFLLGNRARLLEPV